MFVKSKVREIIKHHAKGTTIVLKPMEITEVDETIVSAGILKCCYGPRIEILPDEVAAKRLAEANTGDKAVDNFLNGKTDVVPEGTTEITNEEAAKLEADKAPVEEDKTPAEANEADKTEDGKAPVEDKTTKAAAKNTKASKTNKGNKEEK